MSNTANSNNPYDSIGTLHNEKLDNWISEID